MIQSTFMSRTAQLDDLLSLTCDELQLPPSWHEAAEGHYHAVCDWLEADSSPLRRFRPVMYPQGSFRIGTTVRPIGRDEFDLDFVCQLALGNGLYDPVAVLDAIEHRLAANETYRKMLKRLKRCVRLVYASQFHMDILPARPEVPANGTRILIPDRKLHAWLPSNPKGYAAWFESRGALVLVTLARKAEPIPDHETASEKTPLQRVVQLLKRWRDLAYRDAPDGAPRSIVLTTLAGHAYAGEVSTSQAFTAVVDGILQMASGQIDPLQVYNPANEGELLSEKWNEHPETYRTFVLELRRLRARWAEAQEASIPTLAPVLDELFGEETKRAFQRQAERISKARRAGKLRSVVGSGLLTTAAGRGVSVRPNTFYGHAPSR